MLNKIEQFSTENNYNFVVKNIYNEEKYCFLSKTKIVIHIPSFDDLHTFPWAKVSELMINKIFFIIEENEELYNLELENTIVFYKRKNINDLFNKINEYINNDGKKNKIIDDCYNFIKKKYNLDDLLKL